MLATQAIPGTPSGFGATGARLGAMASPATDVPLTGTEASRRVASVLLAFLDGDTELGVSEIGRRTALSKSTVHRILVSLSSMGILELNPATRLYRPGPAMIAVGVRALQEDRLRHAAAPVLQHLWETTGETVGMSVPLGASRVCTDQLVSRKDLSARAQVGRRIPLLPGASGLVMVAFMSATAQADIVRRYVGAGRSETPNDRHEVEHVLERIREDRVVTCRAGHLSGIGSIAAPVLGAGGVVLAALSISAPLSRLDGEASWDALVVEARQAGLHLSGPAGELW